MQININATGLVNQWESYSWIIFIGFEVDNKQSVYKNNK